MKKAILSILIFLSVFSNYLVAIPSSRHQSPLPKVFIVDDFEDENMNSHPEWWGFGDLKFTVNDIDEKERVGKPWLENKVVHFTGKTKKWYIGGCGVYLGIDGNNYDTIKMIVKGSGEESGTLILELYDDDNNNLQIEPNPRIPSRLLADDKFIYSLRVTWEGWKVILVPFENFIDDNPGIGDDIWNPSTLNGSAGLTQLQLIGITSQERGKLDIKVDSIKLYNQSTSEEKTTPEFL